MHPSFGAPYVMPDMSSPLDLVGRSASMKRIAREISAAASSDVPVLLSGECGVGRRMIAQIIHDRSARFAGPLVSVNCACLPDSGLESELFGHGAGNGSADRSGKLEAANRGTLVLQELGYLSPRLQGRLLRFVDTKEVQHANSVHLASSDVRLMAITHRRLADAVAQRTFRADLFYRMNVIHIEVPPLRERREDIPALFQHFVSMRAARIGRSMVDLTPDALSCLSEYDWPGNVRELKNMAERLALTCELDTAGIDVLPADVVSRSPFATTDHAPSLVLAPLPQMRPYRPSRPRAAS